MQRMVKRCDVCGADDSPKNPVCVTVTGFGDKKKDDGDSMSYFSMLSFRVTAEPAAHVDLCKACGGGLVDLLRYAHARNESLKPKPQPQPSHQSLGDALIKYGIVKGDS